jgi:hypothetical protein
LALTGTGYIRDRRTAHWVQQVTVTNIGSTTLAGPLYYILDNLSSNATLLNASGVTNNPPAGSVYLVVPGTSGGVAPGTSVSAVLEFSDPTSAAITYTPRLLHGTVNP